MSTARLAVPQVVMVAGGCGSRLAETVPQTAKVLAPVHGRPFLAYVLEMLAAQGVSRLHLCLGQHADQVLRFLAGRLADGVTVTTSCEAEPLGTAGGLHAAAHALDEEFILLLGDTYTPVDLADLTDRYRRSGVEAGMAVLQNRDWLVPSNVHVERGCVVRYDKDAPPGSLHHVDYGIAVLRRVSLDRLPKAEPVDLAVLFRSLIADRQLAALEVGHRFYEIGSPTGYAEFATLVGRGELPDEAVALDPSVPKPALASRQVFANPWMRLREDMVRQPDGSLAPFAVVSRTDSVLVICELPDGRLVMTEQYRYAAGRWSLEFPQGSREPGESTEAAALRELREETGWVGADVRVLADRLHEAGDWATHSFAVVSAHPVRQDVPRPEASEQGMRVRYVSRDQLAGHVRSGQLSDAATLAAIALHLGAAASSPGEGEI